MNYLKVNLLTALLFFVFGCDGPGNVGKNKKEEIILDEELVKCIKNYQMEASDSFKVWKKKPLYNVLFDTAGTDTNMRIIALPVLAIEVLNKDVISLGALYLDSTLIVVHDKPENGFGKRFYNKSLLDTSLISDYKAELEWEIRNSIVYHHRGPDILWTYKIKGSKLILKSREHY